MSSKDLLETMELMKKNPQKYPNQKTKTKTKTKQKNLKQADFNSILHSLEFLAHWRVELLEYLLGRECSRTLTVR